MSEASERPLPGLLVVGGAGAVGRATARWFLERGASVCIVDSGCASDGSGEDPARVEEAVGVLADVGGGRLWGLPLDASRPGAAERLLDWAEDRLEGRLGAILWAAGISRMRSVRRASSEDVEAHLRLLFGALELSRVAVRRWAEQGKGGSLLLCVSPAGAFGSARRAFEGAADAGISGFVRGAAVELRRMGIRVNALAPVARSRLTEDLPLFRSAPGAMGPEHVAPVAGFLLSEEAAEVTGEVVAVAGQRVYVLQQREGVGVYFERCPSMADLKARWAEIARL